MVIKADDRFFYEDEDGKKVVVCKDFADLVSKVGF
jgi:hypothetical protein